MVKRAVCVALAIGILACSTFNTTDIRRNLSLINSAYQAAVDWYKGHPDLFTPAELANIDKIRLDYDAAYSGIQGALTAYDANKAKDYANMLSSLAGIVFDILTIIRNHSGSNARSKAIAVAPLDVQITCDEKMGLVLAVGRSVELGGEPKW